jgi:predicted nucleic acid-binding Zn ribbon protein
MERAGRLIAKWKKSGDCVSVEDLARAAWNVAVGKKIAVHTMGVKLVRQHLIVQVEDDVWRRQLFSLRGHILGNLRKTLGEGVVTGLEFRIAARRMGPGREDSLRKPATRQVTIADEADRIEDPVLRNIYKRARNKAS